MGRCAMYGSNKFFYALTWVTITILFLVSLLGDSSGIMIAFKLAIITITALPLRREIFFMAKKIAKGIVFALRALGGHVRNTEDHRHCQVIRGNGKRCGQPAVFAIRTVIHDHDEHAPYLIAGTTILSCRMHHPNPHISGDRHASLETERFLKNGNAAWEGVYPILTGTTNTIGA